MPDPDTSHHLHTVRRKHETPLLEIVVRSVGAAASGDAGDQSHWVPFPHHVCQEMSKRSLTLLCERRAEKREVIKICCLESSTQWHCTLTRVFLSPRELFPGAETLSVTQYLQSLCRLFFVLQPQGSPVRYSRSQKLWGKSGQG